jgi:nucleotide-binding universal stress UspA family protein
VNRLLLATERTEHDAGAERVATALAFALRVPLAAVYPLASNPELLGAEPALALQQEARASAALEALRAQAQVAGVQLQSRVRPGEPLWQQIVAEANEQRTELLVARRVGRRGLLARLLVGEMVSQVAAHVRCPMLMVPADARALWRGRVLAVAHPGSDLNALFGAALALANAAGVPLEVGVPAGTDADAFAQRAETALATLRLQAPGARIGGARPLAVDGITAGAGNPSDLLALGLAPAHTAHGRLDGDIDVLVGRAAGPVLLVGAPRS